MSEVDTQTIDNISSRLYVGNIDFHTTEDSFMEFLKKVGTNPQSIDMPSKERGSFVKYLGFGFVQFATPEEAEDAIGKLNGALLGERFIYVKKALPQATAEEKRKKTEAYFQRKKAMDKWKREHLSNGAKEKGSSEEPNTEESIGEEAPTENASETDTTQRVGKKSKDTVFISNLDYKVTAKHLSYLLKDKGLKSKWIYVPKRMMPAHLLRIFRDQKKTIYNKGIAFIRLINEDTQQRAIKELNGYEINGREIVVQVAIDFDLNRPSHNDSKEHKPRGGRKGKTQRETAKGDKRRQDENQKLLSEEKGADESQKNGEIKAEEPKDEELKGDENKSEEKKDEQKIAEPETVPNQAGSSSE